MTLGNRIIREIARPDAMLIDKLRGHDSADISDNMYQSYTMRGIHQMSMIGTPVVGTAVTVSMPIGGDAFLRVAIDLTQPGDVLIISAQGDETLAMWGGQLSVALRARGVHGVVMDSGVRDIDEIERSGLPVFARGVSTTYGPDSGYGEVNVPISCGGIVVNPGHLVVADSNGIVVVDPQHVDAVVEGVKKLEKAHDDATDLLRSGSVPSLKQAWDEVQTNGAVVT